MRLKGRRGEELRSEKSAEVVLAARYGGEGPNEKESATDVSLGGKLPQMSRAYGSSRWDRG